MLIITEIKKDRNHYKIVITPEVVDDPIPEDEKLELFITEDEAIKLQELQDLSELREYEDL